jgi:hypothetical protein
MKFEKDGMTLYSKDELAGIKEYGKGKILKGEKYFVSVPRWFSGDCGEQMYTIRVAEADLEPLSAFKMYITGNFNGGPIGTLKPVVSLPVLPMETYVKYAIVNIADKTMYTEWGDNVDYLRKMLKEHNLDSEKYALVKQTTTSVYDVIK